MGMAATQARLLTLTNRKNNIGYDLTMLSSQKMALAREADKISLKHNEALNEKRLKWSNDAGATMYDLSYKTLMHPSQMNAYEPYMLTDHAGKVVVDDLYKKYAEMISPNGAPGGNYEGYRSKILSELLGITESEFNAKLEHTNRLEKLRKELALLENESHPLETKKIIAIMLEEMGNLSSNAVTDKEVSLSAPVSNATRGTSWGDIGLSIQTKDGNYVSNIEWEGGEGSPSDANDKLLKIIKELAGNIDTNKYYVSETAMQQAIQATYDQFSSCAWSGSGQDDNRQRAAENAPDYNTVTYFYDKKAWLLDDKNHSIAVSLTNLANVFLINLLGKPEEKQQIRDVAGYRFDLEDNYLTTRKSQDEYNAWQEAIAKKKAEIEACEAEFADPLDAEIRKKIDFYDAIFNAIAKFGWTHNEYLNDNGYLNDVLQTGMYNITQGEESTTGWEYDESTPTTCPNIFTVSDTDAINKSIADYEAQKAKINNKESAIDVRMQKLETEQTAISEMLESYRKMIDDNIDNTFSTFS